jgi:hypothetical protein
MQNMKVSAVSRPASGTRQGQADAGQHGLHQRRDTHAQSHAADGATGQRHHVGTAFAAQAAGEAPHQLGRFFAGGIHHGRDQHRHHELQQQAAHAAQLADEPARQVAGIRCELGQQVAQAQGRGLGPGSFDQAAHQGQVQRPLRRLVRQVPGGGQLGPAHHLVGVVDDGDDGQRERHHEQQQQQQRHRQHGRRAPPAQPALHAQHQWPGGHHHHRGPDGRAQEGPHDPQHGAQQRADEQHVEGGAGEVAWAAVLQRGLGSAAYGATLTASTRQLAAPM